MRGRARMVAAVALVMVVAACSSTAISGVPTAGAPISSVPPIVTYSPVATPEPVVPAPFVPPAPTPPPLVAKGPRPANGTVRPTKRSGLGELDIDNGTDRDAFVTLAKGGKVALTVYVWKGSSAKVSHVADGDYTLYYAIGDGWNVDARRFTADVSAAKFDETLSFRTTRTTSAVFTIGLQPTAGGNASTSDVNQDDIPTD